MAMKLFVLFMCVYSTESLKCQVQVIDSNDYVGCFIDTRTRLLPHKYWLNGNNHPDLENNLCLLYCKDQGYMYFGTQHRSADYLAGDTFGELNSTSIGIDPVVVNKLIIEFRQATKQCFCGDDPYQYGPEDVSDYYIGDYDCDRQCRGDSKQICGGGWRLSVYETGYLPLKQGHTQYKLFSNSMILTAPPNQIMASSSKIDCALNCKISDSCKVYVISTETGECSLYNSYTIMCEGVQNAHGFQVYMMK